MKTKRRATVPDVMATGIEDAGVIAEAVDVLPSNAGKAVGDALRVIAVPAPVAEADARRKESADAMAKGRAKAAVISAAAMEIAAVTGIAIAVRVRNRRRRLPGSPLRSSRTTAPWRPWRT
jgi:hypothetical protein